MSSCRSPSRWPSRLRKVTKSGWVCCQCQRRRQSGATALRRKADESSKTIEVDGRVYSSDSWLNTPASIREQVSRKLHLQPAHPISITRQLIESRFPGFKTYNNFFPVVTTSQNFDSLGFPADHPGRSRTDTYYINEDTVLRTHTSAHQADVFRANDADGWLISADVYRRDAVDRSHYPVFHQMEGARTWDRMKLSSRTSLAEQVWRDVDKIQKHDIEMEIQDPNPTTHPERNPLQSERHSAEEVEAMATHLKRSCENFVAEVFTQARDAVLNTTPISVATEAMRTTAEQEKQDPLRVRWVEAYFPFTSPSWELEVYWQGDWLEVLGSGIVKQEILNTAGVTSRSGWAFGVGLERIAMLLFGIPDIRLFWSRDRRFLSQFTAPQRDDDSRDSHSGRHIWNIKRFVPFSKHPACPKDVAFWLRSSSSSAGGLARSMSAPDFHENDIMELVREVAGDAVEDVRLIDEFTHPSTGRRSLCYRVNYRSLERTLTNEEANVMHNGLRERLVQRYGVELR